MTASPSHESTADRLGTRLGAWRRQFAAWRRGRPFAGGVLLCVAGLLIAWVPLQFATEVMLVAGELAAIGLAFAGFVFLTGVFALLRPAQSSVFGAAGVLLSILSLFGALGGLLVGMLVGIVGGNLCIAWEPPEASAGASDE